jgi:ATP/maltotriose-dependent transcriptional regulator MalT
VAVGSVADMHTDMTEMPPTITDRQRQVVELIASGCSNEEIADQLRISPRTAKAHCDTLRQKLGVPRRRQIPAAYRALTGRDPLSQGLEPLSVGSGN